MLWFLLLLLVVPAFAHDQNGFNIDYAGQIPTSQADSIQLNVSWYLSGHSDLTVNFTIVDINIPPKEYASALCQQTPCLPNFPKKSVPPGWYGLEAHKLNGGWLGDFERPFEIKKLDGSPTSQSFSGSETSASGPSGSNSASSVDPGQSNFEVGTTSSSSTFSTSITNPPQLTQSASQSGVPSEKAQNSENANPDRSAVIGSAVGGGTALIIIILALIYLCRRRRRSRRRNSALGFNRSLMVKNSEHREVEVEMDSRPYSDYPGSSTASVVASDSGLAEKPTERQKEIDERMRHLQDLLSTLESQPQNDTDGSIGKVRDRIKRFTLLKEGDWAKEMSDEKPADLT